MNNFRFKVVNTDDTHYFVSLNFKRFGDSFTYAATLTSASNVKHVDIYYCKTNKLIATFYHH